MLSETPFPEVDASAPARLCWRGDGQHLALSYAHAGTKARCLAVFAQDLTLHARGRMEDGSPVPALDVPVCWSPNGALIAMAQVRECVRMCAVWCKRLVGLLSPVSYWRLLLL